MVNMLIIIIVSVSCCGSCTCVENPYLGTKSKASYISRATQDPRPLERTRRVADGNINIDFRGLKFDFRGMGSVDNANKMEEKFFEVFATLDRDLHSIANGEETIDLMITNGIDGFFVREGTNKNIEEIMAGIDSVSRRNGRDFGYFFKMFNATSRTYNAVERTRLEMLKEFHQSLKYAKSTPLEPELTKMNNFLSNFADEKARICQLHRRERIAILTEEGGLLHHFREAWSPSRDGLQTFLDEIIDKKYAIPQSADDHVAYAALSSMYYGIVSFISMLRYMATVNIYVSDHYYRNRDIEKFNRLFDRMTGDFKSFRSSLVKSGLVSDAIRILEEVAHKNFTRNSEGSSPEELRKRSKFLEQEQKQLKYDPTTLPIIRIVPDKLNAQFEFDDRSLPTPIGHWKDGARVSYAVQYANTNGMFSKVGDWSEPFTVNGRANPCITLPPELTYNRLIFRKFDNGHPQFVGVYEPGRQEEFRDIDSDLFHTSGSPDESVAIVEATSLISVGAQTGTHFDLGRTALHAAANIGNTELARKLLLNDTYSINVTDAHGYTPLHVAAEGGWAYFVKMLVDRGSNINAKTKGGSTPLQLAISNGYADVAEVILQTKDVDVNARDSNNAGSLHLAILNGEETVLSALLANDRTDVNLPSNDHITPLHLSTIMKNEKITQKLIADYRTKINARSNGKLTALHYAVISGNMPALRMLVDMDATDLHPQSINGWTPLHYAVSTKRRDVVSELLELERLSVDVPGTFHITPLHIAALTNQSEVIKDLLLHGENIDVPTSEGLTALHLAANNGNEYVLETLLEMHADANVKNKEGSSVLHLTAANGNLSAVRSILEDGRQVHINLQNNEGLTAMHLAFLNNHNEVIRILLDKGADVNVRNNQGSTVLHLMAAKGDSTAVQQVLDTSRQVQINLQNNEGLTALHLAAVNNHSSVIEMLLNKGDANINARTLNGSTVLHLMAEKCNQQIMRCVLNSTTLRLNVKNNYDEEILDIAERMGFTECATLIRNKISELSKRMIEAVKAGGMDEVDSLILRGADVEYKDKNMYNFTALIWSAWRGHHDMISYLLKRGALLDTRDTSGDTALINAAYNGRLDSVRCLVEKGALLEAKSISGKTALMIAAFKGYLEVAKHLVENGALLDAKDNSGETALMKALYSRDLRIVRFLVERSAPLDAKSNNGQTALMWAAERGRMDIVEILLDKGADINVRNNQGSTFLHLMVTKGHLTAVKLILDKGSQVQYNLQNNEGLTALHLAAINNHSSVIEMLLNKGDANINARTLNGSTVLHLMAEKCNQQIIGCVLNSATLRLNVKNNYDEEILDIAERMGFTECATLIRNKISELSASMIEAVKAGGMDEVKSLILRGADVEFKDKNMYNFTALIWSAWKGHHVMIIYLLKRGALLETKDTIGDTALINAAYKGHLDSVRCLVENGALLEAKSNSGQTALMKAARSGHLEVVKCLVEKGALLEAKDKDGDNALFFANNNGRTEVANYLKSKS